MNRLFTVTFLLSFVSSSYAQTGGSWTRKADLSTTNRESAVGFSVNSKGYIGLGIVGGSPNGAMWEFDPATNVWTQKANMTGGGRVNPVAFVIGGTAYVGTGENISFALDKKLYEFNPLSNVWGARPDFGGTARTEAVGFSIGSKGYIGTGNDGTLRKDFWEFDPTTNVWTQKADFGGTARRSAVGFSLGTKGYIGTGYDGSKKKDFWEYDQSTNTWTQKADMAGGARESAVAFSLLGKGYIATGDGGTGKNDVWEYNPTQDEWIQRTPFIGDRRYVAAAFSYSNKGYIGTGFTDAPSTGVSTKDFYEFIAPQPPIAPTNAMVTAYTETSIRLHWLDNSGDETGFIVERSLNGTTFTALTTVAANTVTYTDNGLSTGQAYYYRVRASKTAEGSSAGTNIASQITGTPGNGVWNTLAEGSNSGNPSFVSGSSTFTLSGIIYITGQSKQLWSYDPASGTFTQKAEFPGAARSIAAAFALNGKGYYGTGSTASGATNSVNDFWQYDPTTNQWAQKSNVGTTGRYGALFFTVGSKGYVGGGMLASTGTSGKDFYEYDPAADTWTQKTDFPFANYELKAVGYNNKGYVLYPSSPASMYEYDATANTWSNKGSFPIKSYGFNAMTVVKDRLFAHAYTGSTPYQTTFWEFELSNARWIERALMYDGSQLSGAVVSTTGDLAFVFNGTSSYFYSLDFTVKTPTSLLAQAIDPVKVKLTWQASSDAATIQIYRAETEAGPYTLIAQVPASQKVFVDEFDGASNTAYYKVRAMNGSLESDYTKVVLSTKRGAWKKINKIANASSEMFGDVAAASSTHGYMGINSYSNTWWEFNPENETWTQKANFPGVPRSTASSFTVQDKIYVGLGSSYDYDLQKNVMFKDFYQYDPASNSWAKKSDFTGAARIYVSQASSADRGYLVGGDDGTGSVNFLNDAWEYNPTTDVWTALPTMPIYVGSPCAFVRENKLYLMNGIRKSSASSWGSVAQAYTLDLATGTWTKERNPAGNAIGTTAYQINDDVYFDMRGMDSYNFVTRQWSPKPAFPENGFYSSRSFSLAGKIYVVTSNYDLWVYSPETLLAPPENLDTKLLGDRILLTWNQTSSTDVKTKIQYLTGSNYYADLAIVPEGITQYVFANPVAENNYKFRVVAMNEEGSQSASSNITFENFSPAWTEISDLPTARREDALSFFANGKLYYGTGTSASTYLKDIWEFDPLTGVWTQKADFPGEERSEATMFTLGTDTYVGFGKGKNGLLKDLYKYSASTNTWAASTNYPNSNSITSPGVFTDGGKAYLVGGNRNGTATINELWSFDGLTWTQLTTLPGETRKNPIVFAVNGKAYVGGGVKMSGGTTWSGGKDFWEYDIATDKWTQLADMPDYARSEGRTYATSDSNNAMVFIAPNGSIGYEGLGIRVCNYSIADKKWLAVGKPLYTEWMNTIFTTAQDPATGFSYVLVADGIYGQKLWRYNYLLNGPNLVEVKATKPGTATLKWRKMNPQPDSVVIFRSTTPNAIGIRQGVIKSSDTTAANAISSGTTYYYKIRAYSNAGQFKTSAEQMLVVDAAPTAPLTLTGELSGDNIVLNWKPGAGGLATSYAIERATQNSSNFQSIGTSTTLTFTSPDLIAATMSYRVKAINSGGESDYSNVVVVMVTGVEEETNIGVYPNPTADFLTIEVAPQDGQVNMQLLDYNGRKVLAQTLTTTTRVDMSSYPVGIYFVNLTSTKRASSKYIKIIKK